MNGQCGGCDHRDGMESPRCLRRLPMGGNDCDNFTKRIEAILV
jgi:hypothetical protein